LIGAGFSKKWFKINKINQKTIENITVNDEDKVSKKFYFHLSTHHARKLGS
jgi:hypothetical protein